MQIEIGPVSSVSLTQIIPPGQVRPPSQPSAQMLWPPTLRHTGMVVPPGELPQLVGLPAGLHRAVQTPSLPASVVRQARPESQPMVEVQCDHQPLSGC